MGLDGMSDVLYHATKLLLETSPNTAFRYP